MPRSGAEAHRRLCSRGGYDATTTAEIAAGAGVTERTFFRYFPDRREALFDGEEAFRDALAEAVLGGPGRSGTDAGAAPGRVLRRVWKRAAFLVGRPHILPALGH